MYSLPLPFFYAWQWDDDVTQESGKEEHDLPT